MKTFDYNIQLTKPLADEIVKAVKLGNHVETAAMVIGVPPKLLNEWLNKGARHNAPEPFRSFAMGVRNAWAASERELVEGIREAGCDGYENRFGETQKDWRALAWLLERRDPKRWGLQIQVNVRDELASMLSKLEGNLSPAEYERVLAIIADDKSVPGLPAHVEPDEAQAIVRAEDTIVEVKAEGVEQKAQPATRAKKTKLPPGSVH